MSEHFTRNTECLWTWCRHCQKMTEHQVTQGRLGRCIEDHTKPRGPVRAAIPQFTTAEIYELHNVETSGPASKQAVQLARHLQALDGPNQRHDGKGTLPARKETRR
jgi:hypothetical protein